MADTRAVVRLTGALLVGLLLAGCGSVGEVGHGASRAGVEPVRGVSGFGSSPYGAVDAQQQAERVTAVAKANQQSGKQAGALLSKTKALTDEAGTAAPTSELSEQPTLDAELKAVLLGLETQPARRPGAGTGDEYADY